jgi:hypothetical protein
VLSSLFKRRGKLKDAGEVGKRESRATGAEAAPSNEERENAVRRIVD